MGVNSDTRKELFKKHHMKEIGGKLCGVFYITLSLYFTTIAWTCINFGRQYGKYLDRYFRRAMEHFNKTRLTDDDRKIFTDSRYYLAAIKSIQPQLRVILPGTRYFSVIIYFYFISPQIINNQCSGIYPAGEALLYRSKIFLTGIGHFFRYFLPEAAAQ